MIEDNILRIEYPTGKMNIFIDKFFPANMSKANVVFEIMAESSPEEDLKELYYRLRSMADDLRQDIDHYNALIDVTTRPKKYDEVYDKLKECQKKHAQAIRNMRDLRKIARLEV